MTKKLLENAEIARVMRPFQLSNDEIGRICVAYQKITEEHPGFMNYKRSPDDADWLSKERDAEIEAQKLNQSMAVDDFY